MKENQTLLEFYDNLTQKQKSKVETKLKKLMGEKYGSLPEESVNLIRIQIASDMFRLIKG